MCRDETTKNTKAEVDFENDMAAQVDNPSGYYGIPKKDRERLRTYYMEDTEALRRIMNHLKTLDYETQLSLFEYFRLSNDGLTKLIGETYDAGERITVL